MKSKLLIAGAIIAVIIVCIAAVAAISTALQNPTKPSQGVFSVAGFVTDASDEGIAGIVVTLHVMGQNGSTDQELYNITTTSQSAQPSAGLFVFDNAILTPYAQYAYLSTLVQENNSTYYGRSDNFTLQNHANVNHNIVMNTPPGYANVSQGQPSSMTSQSYPVVLQSPTMSAQNENSVSGYVVDSSGIGIPGAMVTLHIMGADQASGEKELYNLTTATNSTKSSAGMFVFDNVVPIQGMNDAYLSASAQDNNTTIYGETNNFTINDKSVTNLYIVLHLPTKSMNTIPSST